MTEDDTIQYPIDNLHTTAMTQHKVLNDAWQKHQTHLSQSILTPGSTLPKDIADPFYSYMMSWHQNLQYHFDALHTFLDTLDTGATDMEVQDANIGKAFQDF